jgi:hypothetical protein
MLNDVEALTVRMKKLERQNRHLRLAVIGIALALALMLFAGAEKPPRTIEAQKIVLIDGNGHARLTIGTPALAGATIDVNPGDPVIWLSDEKGVDRAMLTTDGLFFASGKAKPTVSLSSDPRGASGLRFYGTDGKVSWSAP